MICASVRGLPPLSPLAKDDVWNPSASAGVMGSSLNQIATLFWSPYSETTQLVAVNRVPSIAPVAEQRFFAGAAGGGAAPGAAPAAATVVGIGWPTFQAAANAAAFFRSSGVS